MHRSSAALESLSHPMGQAEERRGGDELAEAWVGQSEDRNCLSTTPQIGPSLRAMTGQQHPPENGFLKQGSQHDRVKAKQKVSSRCRCAAREFQQGIASARVAAKTTAAASRSGLTKGKHDQEALERPEPTADQAVASGIAASPLGRLTVEHPV